MGRADPLGLEVLAYNTDVVPEEDARAGTSCSRTRNIAGQTAYTIQDMMSVVMLYLGYDGNMIAYKDDPEKAAQVVEEARDFLIEHKPMVRKYYDAGAEVQQMFVNQDVVLAHAWNGPISTLIMDGFPVDMTIPKEGTYGFVYTLNVVNKAPNPDNAYKLPRRADLLARDRRRDDQGLGLHLHAQGLRPVSERPREARRLVQRGGARADSSSSAPRRTR